eukprot:163466-Pelagomonas_calceolata.AAC.2
MSTYYVHKYVQTNYALNLIVKPTVQVELVKKRCLPGHDGLNLPMLEEYDFRNDRNTPDLNVSATLPIRICSIGCICRFAMMVTMPGCGPVLNCFKYSTGSCTLCCLVPQADLKPHVKLRPYQEKSLSKMFGNGRASLALVKWRMGRIQLWVHSCIQLPKKCISTAQLAKPVSHNQLSGQSCASQPAKLAKPVPLSWPISQFSASQPANKPSQCLTVC